MNELVTQVHPDHDEVYFTILAQRPHFQHPCRWSYCDTPASKMLLIEHRLVPPLVLGLCEIHCAYPMNGNPIHVLTHERRLVLPVMLPHDPFAYQAWHEGEVQQWVPDS